MVFGMMAWQLEFEVSAPSGAYRMTRIFQTESGNLAKDEGLEMQRQLFNSCSSFRLVEVRQMVNGKLESEAFWAVPEPLDITFTENEKAIFKGSEQNEFDDALQNGVPWVFAVIAASGLEPKVARGAIASLVKKGVIVISDYEGKGKADDQIFSYTTIGLEYALYARGYLTDDGLRARLSKLQASA